MASSFSPRASAHPVLSDAVWSAESASALWFKRFLLIVGGVAAIAISSKIKVAIEPVPVTMQMFVVFAIGAAYGMRMALATVGAYLALGAMGYPVFTGTPEKGLGLLYMFGPTGGYLLGYLIGAGMVGALAERGWDRSPVTLAGAAAVFLLCVYVPGVVYLSAAVGPIASLVGSDFNGFGWANWYAYGVANFLWIDALKLALAIALFPVIWRFIGEARG